MENTELNESLSSLIKQYVRKFKRTGERDTGIENKLRQYNIETNFDVDIIYFVDWRSDKVLCSFEL